MPDKELLKISGLNKNFGKVCAAYDLNFSIYPGIITSIIGPNGAGKSTLINMISGYIMPDSGRILFEGKDITDFPTHKRVRLGICRSFQIVNVFSGLSVFDNLRIPVLSMRKKAHLPFRSLKKEMGVNEEVESLLKVIGLQDKAHILACNLSHGDQRILEVGIALATRPKLLFLDEPTAGMNPVERVQVLESIKDISSNQETTFVIVEHDMDVVFSLSNRILVLNHGAIIADGTPEEIRENTKVKEVYLGEEV
jgi:branched-chain amino acid transport system ATP-binding protein